MKAVAYHEYGSPDVLRVEEVEKPTPADDEVLIRVRAAAANPMDYHLMSGMYLVRPMSGLRKPKATRVGGDVAGEIEAVGRNVTAFRPGDSVFGVALGAFAEYVCAREDKLSLKPATITFEQAAAIPIAGITALQGLRDKGRVTPGQKVLINGAAGGVGTFAVQIAKSLGADVTGVCSSRNVEFVRSIGADHAIDYTRQDFTRSGLRYDVLLDCIGNRGISECRRAMTPTGTYVGIGARPGGRWLGPLPHLLSVLAVSPFVKQKIRFFIASIKTEDLNALKELIEAKKVTPVIDQIYPLRDTREAIRYLKEGHARGKVVITMQGDDPTAV